MKKQRKHYSPEEKVAILRRHLLEKEAISKLCDEVGLQPTVFYRWQKEFFENGAAAFTHNGKRHQAVEAVKDRKIAALEEKLRVKNEVLAELLGEYIQLSLNVSSPHDPETGVSDTITLSGEAEFGSAGTQPNEE